MTVRSREPPGNFAPRGGNRSDRRDIITCAIKPYPMKMISHPVLAVVAFCLTGFTRVKPAQAGKKPFRIRKDP